MDCRRIITAVGIFAVTALMGYMAFRFCTGVMEEMKYARRRRNIRPIEVNYYPVDVEP